MSSNPSSSRDVGISTGTQHWHTQAACRSHPDPGSAFFPATEKQARAAARWCDGCPVLTRCAETADRYHDDGVRGGAWRIAAGFGRSTSRYDRILYLVPDAPRHKCSEKRCCTGERRLVSSGWHLRACPVWGARVVDEDTCTCAPRDPDEPTRSVADLVQARDRMVAEYEARRGEAS